MEITEAQYARITPLLPVQRGNVSLSNLQVLNAILYVAEHGCKWRGLPVRFDDWHTIYMRMSRWSKNRVLDGVSDTLQFCDSRLELPGRNLSRYAGFRHELVRTGQIIPRRRAIELTLGVTSSPISSATMIVVVSQECPRRTRRRSITTQCVARFSADPLPICYFSGRVRGFQTMTPLSLPDHVRNVAGVLAPAATRPVGYAALIAAFDLQVPPPDELVAVGERHTLRREGRWRVLTPRYRPAGTIAGHVGFALKHEGVDLGVLNALFRVAPPKFVEEWVRSQPTGQYARRAWFLYEWLTGFRLSLPDAAKAPYVGVLDGERQFAVGGDPVTRYRIRNNLPGTPDYCPLVRRSTALTSVLEENLAEEAMTVVRRTAPDLLARAASFLLLNDSKASFMIEGERPPQDRIQRWGQSIREAGQRPLTTEELVRLQELVVGDTRFTHIGWRTEGGFVGARDRRTNEPLPDHVSARADDVLSLVRGLIAYAGWSELGGLDPVVEAAAVAFGFVFIHPFEDGNGRVHRWLIHHVLGRRGFNPPGVVFPISAVMLEQIARYREVLEHFSRPRLALTRWETTPSLNVRVVNETRDLFRFFDATRQAEFLAGCVVETVRVTLPREIEYLRHYDRAKRRVEALLDLPDATFGLMLGFLRQNGGRFSRRAREREFSLLTDEEAAAIEGVYRDLLLEFDQSADAPAPLQETSHGTPQ